MEVELTPEEQDLREKIGKARRDLAVFTQLCPHKLRPLTEAEKLAEVIEGPCPVCLICDKEFPLTWRCAKSPDTVCHYIVRDGRVTLIHGYTVAVPTVVHYHDEGCVYCGVTYDRG